MGLNGSIMTASSSVPSFPILRSAAPGCGPCGMPPGWSVIAPLSMLFRDMKSPST